MKKLACNTIAFLLVLGILIVSCTKPGHETLEPMRLFMPGDIKVTSEATQVFLYWNPSLYKKSTDTTIKYTVQVSKDSLFNTVERTVITDTAGVIFTNAQLAVRQKYFAR